LDQLLGDQLTDLDDHHAHIARLHDADVARYEDREADARSEVRASRAALADQNREIERIQDELRADALARYMSPGASGIERLISSEDSSRRTRAILSEVTIDLRLEERRAAFAERNRIRARIEDDLAAL